MYMLLITMQYLNVYSLFLQAKAPYDPPSAPGVPKILEVGGDFVHLEWAKPESDGGARIQGALLTFFHIII